MTTTTIDLKKALVAALDEHERAKRVSSPEDNPLVNHDLEQLAHGAGISKGADLFPAKNVAEQGGLGYDMEVARNESLRTGKADKSAKRMAQARARAARKVEFDKIADSPTRPSQVRMDQAWLVVFHMVTIVTQIAKSKQRWASRFLGSNADDIPQMALEKMAVVLAKSDKDLDLLRRAAEELDALTKKSGQIPGDQLTDEERKERKAVSRARKWLMGMANNRVMGALVDSYTDQRNLRWENIDLITTVMASINGVGDDPMLSRFKADRAPAFLGTRFQRPGGIDSGVLATALNAAITERRLDRMTEILLKEENRRTNGQVKWSAIAKQVFLASSGGVIEGEWMWDAVWRSTEHHARPNKARGEAAKLYVRSEFEWLPHLVVSLVESFDQHPIGYAVPARGGARAIMASDFELFYLGDAPTPRQTLVPRLRYSSSEEAIETLVETIGSLMTGEEVVASVVNA